MTSVAQAISALIPLGQSGPWRGVAVLALVLLVLLLAGWGVREWFLLRQTTQLERAARKIAEGDDAARSGLRAGSGTVGRLVAAFDAMAEAVQGRLTRSRERVRAIRRATEKVRRRAARQREKLKSAEASGQELKDELETLRESQARYRAVIGQTAEGFFLANADNKRVLEFNKAFRQMLGYTSAEMRELTVYDFATDSRHSVDAGFQDVLASGERSFVERQYRRKDGSVLDVEVNASVIQYRGREVLCSVVHDITDRKRAERLLHEQNVRLEQAVRSEREATEALRQAQSQLVQSEKLAGLGQMVAGIAHEINNPLSFVINNVAILQRDLRGMSELLRLYVQTQPAGVAARSRGGDGEPAVPDDVRARIRELSERLDLDYTIGNVDELLNRSREGLRRIQHIVRDLRDFARLDESDLHEVDLNEGITSTMNIIAGRAKERRVRVDTELATLPPVECYPAKINQVVMNLVSNAIDASPEGGVVTVRSAPLGDGDEPAGGVRIEVIDRGRGIDPEIRDRIFDPFFTTKPIGQGTGLGLSISYGIVQEHGGTIDVESEPGKGARFEVRLPRRPEKPT